MWWDHDSVTGSHLRLDEFTSGGMVTWSNGNDGGNVGVWEVLLWDVDPRSSLLLWLDPLHEDPVESGHNLFGGFEDCHSWRRESPLEDN